MDHGLGYGMILLTSVDLDSNSGFIKLAGNIQPLSKEEYPDLFAVIGYKIGGADDTFYIPAGTSPIAGSDYYIAAKDPIALLT